ncbi:MAG: hypothetical protein WC965_04475 [Thiohalomonadaceae bacterium]
MANDTDICQRTTDIQELFFCGRPTGQQPWAEVGIVQNMLGGDETWFCAIRGRGVYQQAGMFQQGVQGNGAANVRPGTRRKMTE